MPLLTWVSAACNLFTVTTTSSAGNKTTRPLLKLQPFDGTGSLDTFLNRFDRMAKYLHWDKEDNFHHLCASLEGVVRQVLWDVGPQASTQDVV